jgi:hypothetical protein
VAVVVVVLLKVAVGVADVILKQSWSAHSTVGWGGAAAQFSALFIAVVVTPADAFTAIVDPTVVDAALIIAVALYLPDIIAVALTAAIVVVAQVDVALLVTNAVVG